MGPPSRGLDGGLAAPQVDAPFGGMPVDRGELFGGEGDVLQSVERIVAGLRWKLVVPPVVVAGDLGPADLEQCQELGATIAAGLEAGMF